jgi:hypothetical protein
VKRYLDHLIAIAIFFIALGFYWRQVCPTFYFWDSAELAAAIASGGIPHPPGFPLYLILAKVFCIVIPYDIGLASGLFSAVCGAGSVALFYIVSRILISTIFSNKGLVRVLSIGGSVALTTTASMAAQATRAEVYSLNLLLFMIAFYFISDLIVDTGRIKSRGKRFILASLFLGLGIANHHLTIILVLPAFIYLAFRMRLEGKVILASIAAFILPVTLYGYLIALAMKSPDLNWGNPHNLAALIAVVSGKGFSTPISAFSPSHLGQNLIFNLSLLYRQLGPILTILAIIGVYSGWKYNRLISVFLIICIMFNLISTIFNEYSYYENADIHGYLLTSLICAVIFSLIGLLWIAVKIQSKLAIYPVVIILVIAIAIPAITNYKWADLSGNYSAKILAESIVENCSQGALVITSSYNSYFIVKALQHTYGERKDILVANVYLFGQRWYREDIARRCKLQQRDVQRMDAKSFYLSLINLYKDGSEIYIEYDAQSAPVRNYLMPSGLMMKFSNQATDWDKIDKAEFVEGDLKNITKFISSGMDYELLKTVALTLDNRYGYFNAVGQTEMALKYRSEIDRIAALAQK